jgi:hypothetical protein
MSILIGIAAAVAVARAGRSSRGHDGGAYIGVGLHGRTHLIDFIDRQLASACAREYSVVFLSRHIFFSFSFLLLRSPARISDLRTHSVFVRAAFGQVRERQPAWRPVGAYAFDFFLG